MNLNNKVYAISGAVILALVAILAVGYFAAQHAEAPETGSETATTSTEGKGYTIEQVAIEPQNPAPSLDRKIVFSASVPQEVRVLIQANADTIAVRLKKDPTNGNDWYSLALLYHTANDFEGARAVWEFLVKGIPAPQNSVAYENLGKLYHFDLKDFPKAESYFKQSIVADPENLDAYMELYQLYLYSYKQNTTLAVDTLTKAAGLFPESTAPYVTLGTYYRDKGQFALARSAFEKAMARAQVTGDIAVMKGVGDELAKLPAQ